MSERDIGVNDKLEINQLPDDYTKNDFIDVLGINHMWRLTKGENVKVMLVDTGIDTDHNELKDSYIKGINFINRNDGIFDDNGHGTHMAGLIAGKNVGVAPNVELYVSKSLDSKGKGTQAHISDGITYGINLGVDVICLSLGKRNHISSTVKDRIYQAIGKGIIVVCATGNKKKLTPDLPAKLDYVVAVGGIERDLKDSTTYSNYGKLMDTVSISSNVLSSYNNNNYAYLTGTSCASAITVGSIALLKSYAKGKGKKLNYKEFKEILMKQNRHNIYRGYGIIDFKHFVREIEKLS